MFESTFDCQATEADSAEKFLSDYSSSAFQFALFSLDGVLDKRLSTKEIPSIFLGKNASSLAGKAHINFLPENADVQQVLKKTSELIGANLSQGSLNDQFAPMKIEYFYKVHHNVCDIYLKLTEAKFLKIFKGGNEISTMEILKLRKKKISELYVKSADFEKLVESMIHDEAEESDLNGKDEEKVFDELAFAHDVFHQVTNRIGLNENAVICANKSMELLYNVIEKENNLQKLWSVFMKKRNFVTEHSLMVGYLSAAILSQTAFSNDNNSIKLTLAALLHDVGVVKDKHVESEHAGIDEDKMSTREIIAYKEHVQIGVNTFLKLENGPLDTDKIIAHHHEKYDGTGFPRGIGWSKIPFLSAVFIVAHEFVTFCFANDCTEYEIHKFITQKKAEYTEGPFKEIMAALGKVRR